MSQEVPKSTKKSPKVPTSTNMYQKYQGVSNRNKEEQRVGATKCVAFQIAGKGGEEKDKELLLSCQVEKSEKDKQL